MRTQRVCECCGYEVEGFPTRLCENCSIEVYAYQTEHGWMLVVDGNEDDLLVMAVTGAEPVAREQCDLCGGCEYHIEVKPGQQFDVVCEECEERYPVSRQPGGKVHFS